MLFIRLKAYCFLKCIYDCRTGNARNVIIKHKEFEIMPSAAQLETLINSHYTGDEDHFDTVALQIAASEARSGHEQVAKKLEHLIDSSRRNVQNKRSVL